jgi:hypothetical protein
MSDALRPLVCAQCAQEKACWTEDCPHVRERWKEGYNSGLRELGHPRLTSDDVRRAISPLSSALGNFYHLAADSLNRILDEKEKRQSQAK